MPRNAAAYDEDFFAWTEEQARLLRAGELAEIDALNLAEEVESVGRSDRREIRSRLIVLLTHLLKWHFQPDARSSGWLGTIREQRDQIITGRAPAVQEHHRGAAGIAFAHRPGGDHRQLRFIEGVHAVAPYSRSALDGRAALLQNGPFSWRQDFWPWWACSRLGPRRPRRGSTRCRCPPG